MSFSITSMTCTSSQIYLYMLDCVLLWFYRFLFLEKLYLKQYSIRGIYDHEYNTNIQPYLGNKGPLDLQLHMQSVPFITKVVSSNPVHGEVYSIQHYVIKFVSDLRQVGGFLRVLRFPPPIKLTTTISQIYCGTWR